MQKSNEDCFYFLTSICGKGSSCPYRHNPTVLTCNVICPAWLHGNCTTLACPLRHSSVQRPAINNGVTCFYENTPMGCLKLDCTYVHLRPRPTVRNSSTLRPSSTNLVNKDIIKPSIVINPPINESVPSPPIIPPQPPTPKIETPPVPEAPSPTIKTETVSRRIPIPIENAQIEPTNRGVITDSSEKNQDDTKTPSRVIVNRNVVIAEPNRKVVQGTSNRVVVSSDTINSSKKMTNNSDSDSDLDDLIEQENYTTKTNGLIDIPFPCSVPSITNRLFMSSKPSTPTNDTKPIRLNRDRLPAAKITISNSISSPSNGEKTSAGTGLPQDDDRRTSRLERFKKKANSPPRSVINSSSTIPTRNVINVSPNERKRPASDQIINDSPPSKRLSSQQETNNHHNTTTIGDLYSPPSNSRRTHSRHRRRRRSSPTSPPSSPPSSSSPSPPQRNSPSPRSTYSSTPSMNDSTWKNEVDAFLARTTQPKTPVLPKPVPLLSLRPRYTPPPPPRPPPVQQSMVPRFRPRQPPSVAIKRPLAPVIIPSQIPTKPVEQVPTPPAPSSTISKDDDENENELLELDEPSDVVDTFALIDEALFEDDYLLELG